jgi:3-dehydroquinate dehydratase / shikimate dehydrogenase
MGEAGVITRILATKYNGFLTFAAMSTEEQSAPGQPTIKDMLGMYSCNTQNSETKLYGIIGNPVSHSRSPIVHNTSFQEKGFDGVYVPLLVEDLKRFVSAFTTADWAGFSVTIPHKVWNLPDQLP